MGKQDQIRDFQLIFIVVSLCFCGHSFGQKKFHDTLSVPRSAVIAEARTQSNDSIFIVIPGNKYQAGPIKQVLAGAHYRNVWAAPVGVPEFVPSEEFGGLKPFKMGGHKQTLSLSMINPQGEIFALRSVQKNPSRAISREFRKTFIVNAAQDQVSNLFPYSALLAAELAEHIGIPHAHPRMFFFSKDTSLGNFEELFSGRLVMLEEKAEGNIISSTNFNNAVRSLETEELFAALDADSRLKVDQRLFAKIRLFDMLIGDWDRSEDQWKWLEYENNGELIYKPFPRDRDEAFVKMDGFFPWLSSRKFMKRRFQGFDKKIKDIKGLNYNARSIDRNLLNTLTAKDWKELADSLKQAMNDSVIERSLMILPDTVQRLVGHEIGEKLKRRRDRLDKYALDYYKHLASEVNVPGSAQPELFVSERNNEGNTTVQVYSLGPDKSIGELVFKREFSKNETDEIRLYGLGGQDIFVLKGNTRKKSSVIRVIGGNDRDSIIDSSLVSGRNRYNKIYDLKADNSLLLSEESKDLTSYDVRVNQFVRNDFNYDFHSPKILLDYNPDEGLSTGVGFVYRHYAFRKKPYAFENSSVFGFSSRTRSFFLETKSDFKELLGENNLMISGNIRPDFIFPFSGLGNESIFFDPHDIRSFYPRLSVYSVRPFVYRNITEKLVFGIASRYDHFEIHKKTSDLFLPDDHPPKGTSPDYISPEMEIIYNNTDSTFFPEKGQIWNLRGEWTLSLDKKSQSFSRVSTEYKMYIPIPSPLQTILALRVGASSNFDSFEFYQANYLGGFSATGNFENLRGFHRYRFGGRTITYMDSELRIKLFNLMDYGNAGVLGFIDLGRVWMDNQKSDKWHLGSGGGIWMIPFNRFVVTATYGASEESRLVNLNLGFFF